MEAIFERIHTELKNGKNCVLVTIIDENGSAPRGSGAKMLIGEAGQLLGTVGGGGCEKLAEELALQCRKDNASALHKYRLYRNEQEDIGAVCGGDVSMHFQFIPACDETWLELVERLLAAGKAQERVWLIEHLDGSVASLVSEKLELLAGSEAEIDKWLLGSGNICTEKYFSSPLPIRERAVIFGAGHCAKALAPVLQSVGFKVTVFDERAAFASAERFPGASEIICGDYSRISDYLTLGANDYAVVMTSGHEHDFEVQEPILRTPLAYVGVIGSKKKINFVHGRLREAGVPEEAIEAVHIPIGIKIKSVTPEEIAISIAAEMILCRATLREEKCAESHSCPMH